MQCEAWQRSWWSLKTFERSIVGEEYAQCQDEWSWMWAWGHFQAIARLEAE